MEDILASAAGPMAGALIAGLFAWIGVTTSAGREHKKWLREQRHRAAVKCLAACDAEVSSAVSTLAKGESFDFEDSTQAVERVVEAKAEMGLLFSDDARGAAERLATKVLELRTLNPDSDQDPPLRACKDARTRYIEVVSPLMQKR